MLNALSLTPGPFRWWIIPLAYVASLAVLVGLSLAGLPPMIGQMSIFLGYVALASLCVWLVARPGSARALGIAPPTGPGRVLLIAALAAGVTELLGVVGGWLSADIAQSTRKVLADIGMGKSDGGDFLVILTVCCLAAMGEEAVYRGLIFKGAFDALRRLGGPLSRPLTAALIAAAFAALVFAQSHGGEGQEPGVVLVIGLSGVVYGMCYALTGSLWAAVMAHSFNNSLVLGLAALGSDDIAALNKLAILAMPLLCWALLWLWSRAMTPRRGAADPV